MTQTKQQAKPSKEQAEELISKAEASRRGLSVAGATPVEQRREHFYRIGWVTYPVFRPSDLKPKRVSTKRAPQAVDLLSAIFAANRTAKRYRDAAQAHYQAGTHGFAGASRETKERLYALKDRGIAQAFREGRLQYLGVHGALAIYRGEGYCFHSTLRPRGASATVPPNDEPITVEAKPKATSEARLVDAEFTLEQTPEKFRDSFDRLTTPRLSKPRRFPPPDSAEDLDDYLDGGE